MKFMEANLSYFKHVMDLVEAMPDSLLIINQNGDIILVNALAEKLFGYTRAELLGQPVELLIPDRFINKHEMHRGKYFKHPRVRPMGAGLELFGRYKDGSEFPVEISLSPFETEEGLLALAAIRDITEKKRLEDQLRNKNIELVKANLAKDAFFASMSHELRTPLNAILGFTGTLLMRLPGELNAEQEKQLKTVQKSGKHLLELINDLLDLAKIDAGKVSLHIVEIACHEFIQEILTSLEPLIREKNIKVKKKLSKKEIIIESDKRILTQIIINVINNAIKFTDHGEILIELTSKKIKNQEMAVINVVDTGIGIKKNDLTKLFQAFHQLYDPSKKQEGTGLGLHVSKKLADLIHVNFDIQSEFGKGTHFSIQIPFHFREKNEKTTYFDN